MIEIDYPGHPTFKTAMRRLVKKYGEEYILVPTELADLMAVSLLTNSKRLGRNGPLLPEEQEAMKASLDAIGKNIARSLIVLKGWDKSGEYIRSLEKTFIEMGKHD